MVQPLENVRVVDMATVLAGPTAARYLADFGADVIKVESPRGDSTRQMGWTPPDGGDSYFWKFVARGKRCITLDLKEDGDLATMKRLIGTADVLIENFRPGTLERLGLDPAQLLESHPRLVILRVTGFGQDGPYANRPGFATIVEAMSGYAALSGEPDGQPLLPPIAITDEVAGLVGAFAVMVALRHAERTGEGQVVDVNLLESLLQMMGPLTSAYAHLGYLQPRLGSGLPWTVPRGTYQCADGEWVALSASADSVAHRLLKLIGIDEDERFTTFQDRMANRDALEQSVSAWIGARSSEEVLAAFQQVDAAIAPVYTMREVFDDEHVRARDMLLEVDDVVMPNVIARMSRTPGGVAHVGRPRDADTASVLAELDAHDD